MVCRGTFPYLLTLAENLVYALGQSSLHFHAYLIFAQGLERPRTEPITSLDRCSDIGPFARFIQALGLYSKVNDFNQSYPLRETSDNEKELLRVDSLIQNFVKTFPPMWQDPLLDGEHLLDPTTLALAH